MAAAGGQPELSHTHAVLAGRQRPTAPQPGDTTAWSLPHPCLMWKPGDQDRKDFFKVSLKSPFFSAVVVNKTSFKRQGLFLMYNDGGLAKPKFFSP